MPYHFKRRILQTWNLKSGFVQSLVQLVYSTMPTACSGGFLCRSGEQQESTRVTVVYTYSCATQEWNYSIIHAGHSCSGCFGTASVAAAAALAAVSVAAITTNSTTTATVITTAASIPSTDDGVYSGTSKVEICFCNVLTAAQTFSDIYVQVTRAQSWSNQAQHFGCMSRVPCKVPRGTKGQLSCYV